MGAPRVPQPQLVFLSIDYNERLPAHHAQYVGKPLAGIGGYAWQHVPLLAPSGLRKTGRRHNSRGLQCFLPPMRPLAER